MPSKENFGSMYSVEKSFDFVSDTLIQEPTKLFILPFFPLLL